MASWRYRQLLWLGLGVVLILFYTTYLTARTYYNPVATVVILVLGSVAAISGILLSMVKRFRTVNDTWLRTYAFSKVRALFTPILAVTLLVLSVDIVLTLYAVSNYGAGVEANKVVVSLIARGAWLDWLGQQFTPTLIAAFIFSLSRNLYMRTVLTFFTMGTLGYAFATVANNIFVLYRLNT